VLNSLPRKPSAADMLRRRIAGTPDTSPEPTWTDNAIEFGRRSDELEEEWEAKRQAEQEAQTAPRTTAGILHREIKGSSAAIPLNGDGILRAVHAALGGRQGTINGGNE
jgi:hypothetical protein